MPSWSLATETSPEQYSLIECDYNGVTADLRGKENKFPELVSTTNTGYPFCQSVALEALEKGIEGLYTPSARNLEGTCVPVFQRNSLSGPRIRARYIVEFDINGPIFRESEPLN